MAAEWAAAAAAIITLAVLLGGLLGRLGYKAGKTDEILARLVANDARQDQAIADLQSFALRNITPGTDRILRQVGARRDEPPR